MERSLLSRRDRLRYSIRYDREALSLQDEEMLTKRLETLLKNGVISRNEAREMIGRNPVDGLDEPTPMIAPMAAPEASDETGERGLQLIQGGRSA